MAEVNQSQLSKITGVSRQAVSSAIKRDLLIINSGGKLDTQNPKNLKWLKGKGKSENDVIRYLEEILKKDKKKNKKIPKSNPLTKIRKKNNKNDIPIDKINTLEKYIDKSQDKDFDEIEFENISGLPAKMMKLTLYQLVINYGGPMMLDSWSKILQRLMSASEKDQKIQERRLELIEKDFFISKIFKYLEVLSNMLFDYAKSSPAGFISLVKSGIENIEFEIEKKTSKDFSIMIRDTKENISRELENLKKKYQKDNENGKMEK